MKRLGNIAVCLAGGLALNAGLRADELSLTNNPLLNNPYAPIVIRNVFGVVPPPPPPDTTPDPAKDLPKITVNGIYSVYDRAKALFKASGVVTKPGQPAKDKFYNLREGEGQDDIEVVKIDSKNSLVTFNNHGVVQELPLVSGPGGAAPAAGGGPPPTGLPPGANPNKSGGVPGPNGIITFSGRGSGPNANLTGNGAGAGAGPGGANPGISMNFGGSTQGRAYQPPQEETQMTPEQSAATILIMTEKYKQEGNPAYRVMPPVPGFTPPND